ncbi:MAG: ribosome maturation factor RimM, partial [Pseudomonadota bacterium]
MKTKQGKVLLGHISGLFGVKGWVKIFSYSSPRAQIVNYKQWYLAKDPSTHELEKIYLEDGCAHKKGVIAKFIDVDDRDLAANLLNLEIWVDENELPELEDGDYYWHQLIGLEVFTTDDNYIGNVKNLLETGANDVLIVRDDEQSEYL